jgi:hypothetical protein
VYADPNRFSDQQKRLVIQDVKRWDAVWKKLSSDLVRELYPSENGAADDVMKVLARFATFTKRKRILNMDDTLLEETEAYSLFLVNNVPVPWLQRRVTKNHIITTYYGSLVVSIVPRLERCTDIDQWNECFRSTRSTLDQFVVVADSPNPGPQDYPNRRKRINRFEEKRSRDREFAPRISTHSDTEQALKHESSCFQCGGPRLVRDCPQRNQHPAETPRRSARIANKTHKQVT